MQINDGVPRAARAHWDDRRAGYNSLATRLSFAAGPAPGRL